MLQIASTSLVWENSIYPIKHIEILLLIQKMINIKKIKPMFTKMLVTADVYTPEECMSNGIIESDNVGLLKATQTVVEVGEAAAPITEGQMVFLDLTKYVKRKYEKDSAKADMGDEYYNEIETFNVPTIVMDDVTYLLVDRSDVQFIVTEFEEV